MNLKYTVTQLHKLRQTVTKVSPNTWEAIRSLGICRVLQTRRGFRGGVNQHYHIPTRITNRRNCVIKNDEYRRPVLASVQIKRDYLGSCKKLAKFGLINARSVKTNADTIVQHMISSNVDCCAFTETWIKQNDEVSKAAMSSHGLMFDYHARSSRETGGGTGLQYKSHIQIKKKEAG